jgi:hypothetical protein
MTNGSIPRALHERRFSRSRRQLTAVLLAALVPLVGHAQTSGTTLTLTTLTTTMRSGLHSFAPDHGGMVTVAETGAIGSSSRVTIEMRDDRDTVIAAVTADLRRGVPVRLRAPRNFTADLAQVRTQVRIVTAIGGGSAPVAVFEDIGPDSIVARIIVCGPPARTGGGQEYCPDWVLTSVQS